MNKHIIAIGGGEIRQRKTWEIDNEIVALAGKKHPRLLFIPTASSDSETYMKSIEWLYGGQLGCKTAHLPLLREKPSFDEIKEKIQAADILYVGGGNTLKMMKVWRRLGVDLLLRDAYNSGKVLCGISAGAICWFEYGHSDSMSFYNHKNWNYIRVKGMGLLQGLLCPHYNGKTRGISRKQSFSKMIIKTGDLGIAIEDCAAIHFRNDSFRVIKAEKEAAAYKFFREQGQIISLPVTHEEGFTPLKALYEKAV